MKIYYDNVTGEILYQSSYGYEVEPNFDHDYKHLLALSSRTKESIALLVLRDGEYAQSFQEGTLIKVDPETQELTFAYPNPENPDEPLVPSKPFEDQLADSYNYLLDLDLRMTLIELQLN